jgi:hypothetical protein
MRKFLKFVLRCRVENVLAVVFCLGLLLLAGTTRLFRAFAFGMHDFLFLLLPVFLLGLKALLELLWAPAGAPEENQAPLAFLAGFFRPLLKIGSDWLPFFLLSACYYSLYTNLILRINPHTMDATLAGIDAALLGTQAAFLLEPYINPWLTDFLNVVYLSYVVWLPGVALYFYLKRELPAFRSLMLAYLTIILMGVASYIIVPAVGPEIFFAGRFTRDLQARPLSQSVDYLIRVGRVAHDCYPSLHVGIPLLVALYLRTHRPRAFAPALGYVALMCGATVYLRYHYVVDVLVAFLYAPAALSLTRLLMRWWPGK